MDSGLPITELVILTLGYLLNVSFTTPRENIIHEMRLFRKTSNQFSLTPVSLLFDLNLRDASSCDTRGGGGDPWPALGLMRLCVAPSDDIRTLERPLIGQQNPLIGQNIDLIKSIKKNLAE